MIRSPAARPVQALTPNDEMPKCWRTGRHGSRPSVISSMSSSRATAYSLIGTWCRNATAPGLPRRRARVLGAGPEDGRVPAQRRPQRTRDPRGILAACDAQHRAPLGLGQLGGLDAEPAQRPVAANERTRAAPVAPRLQTVPAMQVVQRIGLLERAPQDRAALGLGGVLDDRLGAAAEREAGGAGAQAQVDV